MSGDMVNTLGVWKGPRLSRECVRRNVRNQSAVFRGTAGVFSLERDSTKSKRDMVCAKHDMAIPTFRPLGTIRRRRRARDLIPRSTGVDVIAVQDLPSSIPTAPVGTLKKRKK